MYPSHELGLTQSVSSKTQKNSPSSSRFHALFYNGHGSKEDWLLYSSDVPLCQLLEERMSHAMWLQGSSVSKPVHSILSERQCHSVRARRVVTVLHLHESALQNYLDEIISWSAWNPGYHVGKPSLGQRQTHWNTKLKNRRKCIITLLCSNRWQDRWNFIHIFNVVSSWCNCFNNIFFTAMSFSTEYPGRGKLTFRSMPLMSLATSCCAICSTNRQPRRRLQAINLH